MPYRNESNYSKLSSKDLLEIRKRYNLTQVEIAKLLGIGHRTYRYYEVDEKPIPTLVANALSSLGNISLDEFQGTLTSYDMDRMRRLRDEIECRCCSCGENFEAIFERVRECVVKSGKVDYLSFSCTYLEDNIL